MIHPVIAIDGPSASGKGTVSTLLAAKLNFVHVDTGAMYRAFAWLAFEKNIDPSSREAIKNLIRETKFEIKISVNRAVFYVNDIEMTTQIREPRINQTVATISQIPELREYLVNRQRQLRLQAPLVMEGRDIGTVVATDSPYKFFLDANPEVRAARRAKQGEEDSVKQRDNMDSTRQISPLTQAADATKIDTSNMTIEEVVESIYSRLLKKGILKNTQPVSPV